MFHDQTIKSAIFVPCRDKQIAITSLSRGTYRFVPCPTHFLCGVLRCNTADPEVQSLPTNYELRSTNNDQTSNYQLSTIHDPFCQRPSLSVRDLTLSPHRFKYKMSDLVDLAHLAYFFLGISFGPLGRAPLGRCSVRRNAVVNGESLKPGR